MTHCTHWWRRRAWTKLGKRCKPCRRWTATRKIPTQGAPIPEFTPEMRERLRASPPAPYTRHDDIAPLF